MTLVVCLNPAIDLTYHVDRFRAGESHRVRSVVRRAGGKGVNVARVLAELGESVVLAGVVGGPTGEEIAAELRADRLDLRMCRVEDHSRQTLTVVDPDGATTLSEPGPVVTAHEWRALCSGFAEVSGDGIVVISGSAPPGTPADAYAQLSRIAHGAGSAVVVDADGPALLAALAERPELVKPNAAEAGDLLGRTVVTLEDALDAARSLVARGARAAIVSCGERGCALAGEGVECLARIAEPVRGNPTGAGDALVATVAHGWGRGRSWPDILGDATAVSAASVAVPFAGAFDRALADRLRGAVSVEVLR